MTTPKGQPAEALTPEAEALWREECAEDDGVGWSAASMLRVFATLDATRAELAAAVGAMTRERVPEESVDEATRVITYLYQRGSGYVDAARWPYQFAWRLLLSALPADVADDLMADLHMPSDERSALASLSASAAAYRRSVLVEGAEMVLEAINYPPVWGKPWKPPNWLQPIEDGSGREPMTAARIVDAKEGA